MVLTSLCVGFVCMPKCSDTGNMQLLYHSAADNYFSLIIVLGERRKTSIHVFLLNCSMSEVSVSVKVEPGASLCHFCRRVNSSLCIVVVIESNNLKHAF